MILLVIKLMLVFLPFNYQQTYPFDNKVSIQTINLTYKQKSQIVNFKLNCQEPNILIGNTFFDLPKSQFGFYINYTIQSAQKQITFETNFKTNDDNQQISFQFAEICIDTFYVEVVEIKNNISFKNNIFAYTYNYANASTDMAIYAYLIGYQYQSCSDTQSITIQNCTANEGSFTFEFFTTTDDTITSLKINFVAYKKNNSYYYLDQINDNKYKQIQDKQNPLNQIGQHTQYSDEYSSYIKNNITFIMIGLNGFILSQKQDYVNLNLTLNNDSLQKNIQLIYSKQESDSIIYGYTSQVLIFQMKKCESNKINSQDQCIDICPQGFFKFDDQQRQISTCKQCAIYCKTCEQDTECLLCNDDFPYYLSDTKLCQKDYPTKYVCSDSKQSQQAKYICDICKNCLQNCNSAILCCNNQDSDSYTQFQDQICKCKDETTMNIDLAIQKCSCKDPQKMKINGDKNSCICQDSQTMVLNSDKSSCNCIDITTMKFQNNKCVCQDEMNMIFQRDKCDCFSSMSFNVTKQKCECKDINFMQYIESTKSCECPKNSTLIQDKCVCLDNSYYMDQNLKNCVKNPNIANCEIPNQRLPQCLKCQKGYRLTNGICKFCGNGKFFDDVTNDCTQSCIQYCYFCSSKQDCKQYEEQFPCHFSCQLCTIPNSATACSLCSSSTRQFNSTDNSCNCLYGYEETGQIDCKAIQQSFSQSFLTLKAVFYNLSYYVQLFLAITPFFPYIQYSFILQQQIGLISQILPNDDSDMRIELLNEYNYYNFKFLDNIRIIQSENIQTQEIINQLVVSGILLGALLLLKLASIIIKNLQKNPSFNQFQAFMFIIASRLLSTQVIFSVTQIFLQSNQLKQDVKALATASVDGLIVIFFILSQIYHCKEVSNNIKLQKQSLQISSDIKQILNNSQNGYSSPYTLNKGSQDTQLEIGKKYKNPSILDTVTIAIILFFQSITILNALIVFYFKIKAIIIQLTCKKGADKSKTQQDSFFKGSFPQQIDISL
ncbi:hypothetical protein ABPG74_007207 [Tetrahymena malaccensis]